MHVPQHKAGSYIFCRVTIGHAMFHANALYHPILVYLHISSIYVSIAEGYEPQTEEHAGYQHAIPNYSTNHLMAPCVLMCSASITIKSGGMIDNMISCKLDSVTVCSNVAKL